MPTKVAWGRRGGGGETGERRVSVPPREDIIDLINDDPANRLSAGGAVFTPIFAITARR